MTQAPLTSDDASAAGHAVYQPEGIYLKFMQRDIKKVVSVRLKTYRRLIRFRIQLLKAYISGNEAGALPDVLCVGVPKAATTWLYFNLYSHPEVYLPPGKELHFFSHAYKVLGSDPVFSHQKKNDYWKFQFDLSNEAHWRWYKSQFKCDTDKLKIDITPTYCRVSKDRIAEIKNWLPDAKIILIIRNPITRAWSGASYFLDRDRGLSMDRLDTKKEVLPWVLDPERLDYGNYVDMIKNWDECFSESQIKYVFYDDINKDPESVLETLSNFIGIESIKLQQRKNSNKRINSNYKKIEMPIAVKVKLQEIYKPQIDFLENRFKRNLDSWKA